MKKTIPLIFGQSDKQEQTGPNGRPVREIQVITGVPRGQVTGKVTRD
jgi:hypothetical protein